jgi:hypothetical protein
MVESTQSKTELPRSEHATIVIEILKQDQQIRAGGVINIQVMLDLKQAVQASHAEVSLYGIEDITYMSTITNQL